jgi:hypothetical protein
MADEGGHLVHGRVGLLHRAAEERSRGDGTLLDHTLLIWGSTGGTENAHNNNNLPTMLAGGHRLGVRHQGHIVKPDTRLGNLWQTMFGVLGVPVPQDFQGGEADGALSELV